MLCPYAGHRYQHWLLCPQPTIEAEEELGAEETEALPQPHSTILPIPGGSILPQPRNCSRMRPAYRSREVKGPQIGEETVSPCPAPHDL